jgi:hypothetical protein
VVSLGVLSFLLSGFLISQTTRSIERAFFQDDPSILYSLLSTRNRINVSLPEPILFSDLLSREQTYFLFRRISSAYSTFEFYADLDQPVLLKERSCIFKARWSLRNKKDFNQEVLQVFFYLILEKEPKGQRPPGSWRIAEIRAERL